MGKPTIDGLRLALYDNKFCVSNEIDDPNSLPNLSINNLTIKKNDPLWNYPRKTC